MKSILSILIFTTISNLVFGQTNYEKFKKLFGEKETVATKALLTEWEKSNPNDPELYTSAFNYYFSNSKQELISLDRVKRSKESIQFTDSSGKVAGYINPNLGYNPIMLDKALYYINKGIDKFPNRLDIRFGKCYVLGQVEEYKDFSNEIIKTIEYSLTIKNDWLWTENKKVKDAEDFMLGSIQDYLKQLYEKGDNSLLDYMKQIGDLTIKYYPNNVEILSTTSVAYMLTNNYDKAIGYLKQAEKINPKDYIVLSNLAQGYKRMGDKANAIKYYEIVAKYGDKDLKQEARTFLKELKQ